LGGGEEPAEPRLRALAELDLDRAHLRREERLEEPLHRELALGRAGAEIAGAELPDDLAALSVVVADPALAGVLQRAALRDAAVDRLDGGGGQRPVAHRRGVDDRRRAERLAALAVAAERLGARDGVGRIEAGLALVRRMDRECALPDDEVVRRDLEVVVGAE